MKKLLLITCYLVLALGIRALALNDPSHWTMKVLPGNGSYNMVFAVQLDSSWHIWALDPGGDGTLIAPSFTFDKGSYTMIGGLVENGNVKEETMEGIDGKVRYFMDKAEFVQTVKAAPGATLKGTFTYQLCNNMMCLPPKTALFEFHIP